MSKCKRNRQWNLDLAMGLCFGAVLGSPIGPFIRVYLLDDPDPFKAVIGLALFIMAGHLFVQITPWYLQRTVRQRAFKVKFDEMIRRRVKAGKAPSGLPDDFKIKTIERSLRRVTIDYWDETQRFVPEKFLKPMLGAVTCLVGHTLHDQLFLATPV